MPKSNKIHFRSDSTLHKIHPGRMFCGCLFYNSQEATAHKTKDIDEVTCKRCLQMLEKAKGAE